MHDLVIGNARLIDGLGAPARDLLAALAAGAEEALSTQEARRALTG